MMFRATLFRPDLSDPRCNNAVETRYFGTRRAMLAWAKPLLGYVTATRYTYHDELRRAPAVRVERGNSAAHQFRRGGLRTTWLSPEVIIVPSVGELGYW